MESNKKDFVADFKARLREVKKTRWIRFGFGTLLFFAFIVWLNNYWWVLAYPILFDMYLTNYVPWSWWKHSKSKSVRTIMSWVDSIVYALVLVYFVFAFIGQNYRIPSSSLEKTLLVGDYLWVNKMCYGPRVPMTPIHFPLTQNTLPIIETKSYLEHPQIEYRRLKGYRNVERYDIVVFNYPAGDTIAYKVQNPDYYTICYSEGRSALSPSIHRDLLAGEKIDVTSYEFGQRCIAVGREIVKSHPDIYGEVMYRPVDRRENYVKRAIGLPGDYLKIVDHVIYINGKPLTDPENVQYAYNVVTGKQYITPELFDEMEVSNADRVEPVKDAAGNVMYENLSLTNSAVKRLRSMSYEVERVPIDIDFVYPIARSYGWTRADYAPMLNGGKGMWIPKKGSTLKLTMENLPIYERAIKNYEHNDLEVRDGKIFINGKEATEYTFKMDYYWMMGDNRDNSLDSRYWGFVPEDHIVGTPMFVIVSFDQDKSFFNSIRWDRILKDANPDK